jgi:predicted RNase H-like nuclease (RuvC/YqgF family)
MAENTTTRVVEVQVDNAEAIKLIADYNAKIEESTAKEKALREAIKKKGEATAADREELAKLRAEQTAYKRELREVEKEVQNNIKAAREEEGSNRKLRAELSNLTKQYDSMSAAMQKSAEGEALKKQINEITDALLESEEVRKGFTGTWVTIPTSSRSKRN